MSIPATLRAVADYMRARPDDAHNALFAHPTRPVTQIVVMAVNRRLRKLTFKSDSGSRVIEKTVVMLLKCLMLSGHLKSLEREDTMSRSMPMAPALAALLAASYLGTAEVANAAGYNETDFVVGGPDANPVTKKLTDANGVVHSAQIFDQHLVNAWGLLDPDVAALGLR